MKRFAAIVFCGVLVAFGATRAGLPAPEEQAAIDRISANSLRGNLSFLASDALEGRATPSRGLDVAAEFIASQFRRAKLEPVMKDGSYFQIAKMISVAPQLDDFRLRLRSGEKVLELSLANVRVRTRRALDLDDAAVAGLPHESDNASIEGQIVAGASRWYDTEPALRKLQSRKPALILLIGHSNSPEQARSYLEESDSTDAPVIRIRNADAADALNAGKPLKISLHIAQPRVQEVTARNVAGILRGSDPVLRDQYLLVTAHYDHLGVEGARIYHGANDDGSGTVSVIEIANALAALPVHPRRSILFLTFFGEEEDLLGSYYYTRHPLVPLKNTVADLNLEQLGRTDDSEGARIGAFAITGESFSSLPSIVTDAARSEDVQVYSKSSGNAYFDRSDNYAFALAGVVAHTIVVAFEFPDYHGLGDDWQKIDYANMAKIDRAVAAGVLRTADSSDEPRWSEVKETAVYRAVRPSR